MKKILVITMATMTLASAAQAGNCGDGTACGVTGLTSMVTVLGSSALVGAPFITTSEALKNDIIAVDTDAAIALETGVASQELLSVIQKIRAELPEMANKSDVEIATMIVNK